MKEINSIMVIPVSYTHLEKNKEAYDEIYETEQKIKDEAEKRKTQGIWRTVGGAVLIATGVACIVPVSYTHLVRYMATTYLKEWPNA